MLVMVKFHLMFDVVSVPSALKSLENVEKRNTMTTSRRLSMLFVVIVLEQVVYVNSNNAINVAVISTLKLKI